MDLNAESEFFHQISKRVIDLVNSFGGNANITKHKEVDGDFATEVDIAVEKLITKELSESFPSDRILAEEEHSDTLIDNDRIWIIDPICGTSNLGRGVKNYCTNIALSNNKQLLASCVIDHSYGNYIWSIGGKEVYVNDALLKTSDIKSLKGTVVDVDLGTLPNVNKSVKEKVVNAVLELSSKPGWMLLSLNTSLGFAYTAIGKLDGFINVFNHSWDICASAFLIQQMGGFITDTDGQAWNVSSLGAIGALDESIHRSLLDAYKAG